VKIKIRVVLEVSHRSDEKARISHANGLIIYCVNEFVSLFKFCRSNYCIGESNDVDDINSLAQTDSMCLSTRR
jgi:hypothetical protein